jgi:hypothetical protein
MRVAAGILAKGNTERSRAPGGQVRRLMVGRILQIRYYQGAI